MLRKILLPILMIVAVLSLVFNFINKAKPKIKFNKEEERAQKTAETFRFFGYGDSRVSTIDEEKDLRLSSNDKEFLEVIDTAVYRILTMQEEFVGTSGGRKIEDGTFMNAYGINYIEKYFYGENYFRSNAINFFNKTIEDYTTYMKNIGFSSSLVRSMENHKKYENRPLFKGMTVAETMAFMDLLKSHMLLDRYIFLAKQCNSN